MVIFKFNGTYVNAGAGPAATALLTPKDIHPGGKVLKLEGITQLRGVGLYITVTGMIVPAVVFDLNEKLLMVTGNAEVLTISKPTRLDPLLATRLVASESTCGVDPRAFAANCETPPEHITEGVAVALTTGRLNKLMVTESTATQPEVLPFEVSVAVTKYLVCAVGETTTDCPLRKPGLH
jgi:hypothetical protein